MHLLPCNLQDYHRRSPLHNLRVNPLGSPFLDLPVSRQINQQVSLLPSHLKNLRCSLPANRYLIRRASRLINLHLRHRINLQYIPPANLHANQLAARLRNHPRPLQLRTIIGTLLLLDWMTSLILIS